MSAFPHSRPRTRAVATILSVVLAVALAGCGPGGASSEPTGPASLGPRPSSLATVTIAEPAQGVSVAGTSVHIVLKLDGARIVPQTTTAIRPDEGHVHLYVDNQLVSMNYGLEQDIPVHPGTLVIRAEFVAADHAPFNPRVISPDVVFSVR
jgi:hypothetical protein